MMTMMMILKFMVARTKERHRRSPLVQRSVSVAWRESGRMVGSELGCTRVDGRVLLSRRPLSVVALSRFHTLRSPTTTSSKHRAPVSLCTSGDNLSDVISRGQVSPPSSTIQPINIASFVAFCESFSDTFFYLPNDSCFLDILRRLFWLNFHDSSEFSCVYSTHISIASIYT